MGIFNMFIVIPMLLQMLTLPLYYRSWLGGNPENVIRLAGGLMLCGALAVLFVKLRPGVAAGAAAPADGQATSAAATQALGGGRH
jgi:maltose/moltooligosaccharide transporter